MIYGWSEWLAVRGLIAAKRQLETGGMTRMDVGGVRSGAGRSTSTSAVSNMARADPQVDPGSSLGRHPPEPVSTQTF
jgi:hypothetical protein